MKLWSCLITLFLLLQVPTLEARTFKTEQWQTAAGTKVVFYRATEVPMLDVNIAFAAGSAYDGKQFGLSALTTQLLNQGNSSYNAMQIAERFADVGAQFNADTSRDMVVLQLRTLSKDKSLNQAIDNLHLLMTKPSFPQEAFYREKTQQMADIKQMQESPNDVANLIFFDKLYQNHPYGHSVKGTVDQVKTLTRYDVRNFYTKYFVASNAVIVLVGDIDSAKAHAIAEQLTQNLPKGEAAAPIPKAKALQLNETVKVNFPSSQTMLRLGQLGIDHNTPDYFPLMVGNYILGGGSLVSRLSNEVREKRGLTYGVDSQLMPMPGDGPFLISLSTQNKQASTALKVTEDTLHNFLSTGPSEEELAAAKQYLIGSYPLSLSSNSSIAGMLLRMAFYHLPEDYLDTYTAHIAAVSIEDVKKAFAHQINPDKMLLVSVGSNPQNS